MSRLEEQLVSNWSPYALNASANLIAALWLILAWAGFALLPRFALAVLIVPLFGAIAARYWLMLIGLCPCCNKSPMLKQFGNREVAKFLRSKRVWPERICSACGCNLTVVPS